MVLPHIFSFAQSQIEKVLKKGDVAIDGTVGNGHDTLFLAGLVGGTGRVYGFDVQQAALNSAQTKLEEANAAQQVTFFLRGHEHMEGHIPAELKGSIKAAMFNLGYLPGSDKVCITTQQTTIPALETALHFLAPTGILTIVLYPAHAGGKEEAEAVMAWAQALGQKQANVLLYDFINQKKGHPFLLVIEKN